MAQISKPLSLYYLVREPKIKSEKAPLLLFLHGIGSNEEDLFSLENKFPENFLIVSARAPYTLGLGSYAWYEFNLRDGKTSIDAEQAENSRLKLLQFMEELKNNYSIDANKIYLCGFSQGAIMSYSVGLTKPELVHGIAIMSGRLLDEVKPKIASNQNVKQLKVFISHGTEDPTIDIAEARKSVDYLKTLGLRPTYKEYSERHTISPQMLEDLVQWIKIN